MASCFCHRSVNTIQLCFQRQMATIRQFYFMQNGIQVQAWRCLTYWLALCSQKKIACLLFKPLLPFTRIDRFLTKPTCILCM